MPATAAAAASRRSTPSSRTRAARGVDQPDQQRGQRGLAASRSAPTSATVRPRLDGERRRRRSSVGPSVVGEADVVDPSRAPSGGAGRARRVAVRHLAGRLEHALHPVEADDAARELAEHPADRADRERQQREQVGDRDQVAGVGRAALDPGGADEQHGEHAEAGQRLHQRVEQPADPADRDVGVAQLVRLAREALGLLGLAAQRLDDQRAVEALVRDLADLGAQLLGAGHQRRLQPLVDDVDDEHRGKTSSPTARAPGR